MAAATEPKIYPASKGNPSEYTIRILEVNAARAARLFAAWKAKL